jgi:hypothetical protein
MGGGPQIEWGDRVEGVVTRLEGARAVVRFGDREEAVGPIVAGPDPRRPGDTVDLGLDRSGALIRVPEGPASDGAQLRAEMAKERSLLRKLWDAV